MHSQTLQFFFKIQPFFMPSKKINIKKTPPPQNEIKTFFFLASQYFWVYFSSKSVSCKPSKAEIREYHNYIIPKCLGILMRYLYTCDGTFF